MEQIKTHEEEISELKISNTELKFSNTELKSHIDKLIERNASQDEARLRLFRANTLVDLVKKLSIDLKLDPPEKPDETKDSKKRRITQVAQSIKQQQLEFFLKEDGKKYGPLYFKLLQKMDKVRD